MTDTWEALRARLAAKGRLRVPGTATEPARPSRARRVLNAAGAAGRAAGAVARGEAVLAPPDGQAARLAVCLEAAGLSPGQTRAGHCEAYRPSDGTCSACGCCLAGVLGKARLLTEDCPKGRWPAIAPPEPGGSP